MFGNTLSRAIFFWPAALFVRLGQFLLSCSQTRLGRYAVRPVFRLFCRFVLYARPYLLRGPRTNNALPTPQLCDLLDGHKLIAAIPCVCRAGSTKCENSHHSEHEREVCLSFGLAAIVQVGSGLGRRLSSDEAKALCQTAAASGLAHHAIYSFGSLLEVCNCCPDSCSVIKAYEAGVPEAVRPSPFVAVRGPDCDVCSGRDVKVCEGICPYGKHPSSKECFGCGLCAAHCAHNAIVMRARGKKG